MLFDHTYIFHDFLTAIHALLIHYILYRLSLQKLYFQCLCQLLILPAASYRNPDILSSVRNLSREILNQNLLFQKLCRQFLALPAVDQLAHKIICRGRIYLQSLDLAQLPVTVYLDNIIKGTLSFRGSKGQWVTQQIRFDTFEGHHYMKLYFGATGLTVDHIAFQMSGGADKEQ